MKNKLFAFLLTLLMLLSITACTAKKDGTDTTEPSDHTGDTIEDTVTPDDTETEPGAEDGEPSEGTPDALPEDTVPDSTPEDNPSDGDPDGSVDLTAFYDTLFQGADSPSMDKLPADSLDVFYPGLSEIETNQLVVAVPMISAVSAEIALIEVADSADIETVKTILQTRIDDQVAGGAWYPATIEMWENNSAIVANGNYIMLIVLDTYQDVVDSFNALFA